MLRYTLPAACPLSLLRADNSPHLTAVRSVEAVPDDPAADSLDRADAGADSSGDQYRCNKTYAYSDRILYTYPDGDADRLLELYCTADVQTAQGVGIGASRKDVEAAYGTEYTQAGSTMTYALAAQDSLTIPASLYFELDGDTVCAIGLTSAHRAE